MNAAEHAARPDLHVWEPHFQDARTETCDCGAMREAVGGALIRWWAECPYTTTPTRPVFHFTCGQPCSCVREAA